MDGIIVMVSKSADYTFSKPNQGSIRLLAGLGVEGDVHSGEKVKHRFRVKRDPHQPNLRQVHLIHSELHDELRAQGFDVIPYPCGFHERDRVTEGWDTITIFDVLPATWAFREISEAIEELAGIAVYRLAGKL